MSKIKKISGNMFRVALSVLLIIFLCTAPLSIMPSLLKSQANINRTENYDYQGILELWHVETFEGGSKSRAGFLEKQAISFEKQHKGTYVVVSTMTLEQFELNIKAGKKPNMLSFGIGVGDEFTKNLVEINTTSNVRDDLLSYGKLSGKQLAMPYILGGYALISKNQNEFGVVGVGGKGTNNPYQALLSNNIKVSFADNIQIDTYSAYDKFIKGNYDTLLGTQRDVYRVFNRMQNGSMENVSFKCLTGYTDLVQYLSIFESNGQEEKMCQEFANNLTSQDVQQKLADYNLYTVLDGLKIYTQDVFLQMEEALSKTLKTENAFANLSAINDKKSQNFDKLRG